MPYLDYRPDSPDIHPDCDKPINSDGKVFFLNSIEAISSRGYVAYRVFSPRTKKVMGVAQFPVDSPDCRFYGGTNGNGDIVNPITGLPSLEIKDLEGNKDGELIFPHDRDWPENFENTVS